MDTRAHVAVGRQRAAGSPADSEQRPSRIALTKRIVDQLRRAGERVEVWDATLVGFGLTVYGERASYVLRHRPRGQARRRHTIGDAAVMELADAREEAKRILREDTGPATRAITVAGLLDHFLANHRSRKKGLAPSEDRDTMARCKVLRERWGVRGADELTHVDVGKLLAEITGRGSPYAANRMRALIRSIWTLARRWGFVPSSMLNPAEGTPVNRERQRDVKALKPAEVQRLLAAASRYPNPWAGAAIKLLALTGCRMGEVLSLRWADVDTDAGMMLLRDRKGGDTLALPLSSAAVEVLRAVPRQSGAPWVFPSSRRTAEHLVDLRDPWAEVLADADLPPTTRVHDMRAAVATNIAAAAGLKVAKLVLGHADERTTMRYVRPASEDLRAAVEAHGEAVAPSVKPPAKRTRKAGAR